MRYAEPDKFFSNPGDPIHVLYSPKVDDNGNIDLVVAGKENIPEIVNSYAESTDIQYILSRAAQGDLSGLTQNPGIYGDFTSVPKTYAEFLQLQIDANGLFYKLPQDVRDKFNNDPSQFLAQSGTEEWQKKLGDVLPLEYRYKEPQKEEVSAE